MNILSFDVGGTFIKYALINEEGILSEQGKVETPMDSQESFLCTLGEVIEKHKNDIEGIAMSLPGFVDVDNKYVAASGSLHYNTNSHLGKMMEERFHFPFEMENDAKSAALAEMWNGNLKGIDNGLVLTFGTGIGGAFVIDGKLYKGTHLISGEVSIILTDDVRTKGLAACWGEQGSIPNLVNTICIAKGVEVSDGHTVFDWIAKNDEIACSIFKEYCFKVAQQLHNLQCVIDPRVICIGGGVSENPVFIEGIKAAVAKFYKPFGVAFPRAEIVACVYHNNANLIGAWYHFMKRSGKLK